MSRHLVNARIRAESTEWSRFPPPSVEFCSVGSSRACRVFEWAITQPIVRDDPWHHIDLWCIRASLRRARSPQPHAGFEKAHVFASIQMFWVKIAHVITRTLRLFSQASTSSLSVLLSWYSHSTAQLDHTFNAGLLWSFPCSGDMFAWWQGGGGAAWGMRVQNQSQ